MLNNHEPYSGCLIAFAQTDLNYEVGLVLYGLVVMWYMGQTVFSMAFMQKASLGP